MLLTSKPNQSSQFFRVLRKYFPFIAKGMALCCLAYAISARAELAEIIPNIKHSVVAVGSMQSTRSPAFQFKGTGFVVGDGTLIATNAHVVSQMLNIEARENWVVLSASASSNSPHSTAHIAVVIATDPAHDLALLRIQSGKLPVIQLGAERFMREGQSLALTGFPLGHTMGFFPATHRALVAAVTPAALPAPHAGNLNPAFIKRVQQGEFTLYQLDAITYPGNSGSPVYLPETGEVVAVLNAGLVKTTRENAAANPTGISFAVPVKYLKQLIQSVQ